MANKSTALIVDVDRDDQGVLVSFRDGLTVHFPAEFLYQHRETAARFIGRDTGPIGASHSTAGESPADTN